MIVLGLTGYPLGHSLSPRIHQVALDHCDLKGNYALYPVAPDNLQGLRELLEQMRIGEITGLNVTIPYKRTIMAWLDTLTPAAQAIGAVNTIFMQNGQLTGGNTDAPGFLADLHKFLDSHASRKKDAKYALLLGAGGAARAVTYALLSDGWDVIIAARRAEQAQMLVDQFPQSAEHMHTIPFEASAFQNITDDLLLVVNATPLGMSPHVGKSPWPGDLPLPKRAVVYDLVYNPRETRLVCSTREAGLPAICGFGMLVEQAALAFETWTGCCVPREILFAAMEER